MFAVYKKNDFQSVKTSTCNKRTVTKKKKEQKNPKQNKTKEKKPQKQSAITYCIHYLLTSTHRDYK